MAPFRKKGQTIHSEAREIIRHVVQKCDEESNSGTLQYTLNQSNKRVANYTGISVRSVTKIRKEGIEAGGSILRSPGKKRPYSEEKKFHIDDFDKRVIRDTIDNFYTVQKKVPTAPKLLAAIKEKINFPWGVSTLRKLLKEMGFKWKRCGKVRKVLIERPDIVNWRARFLRDIQNYRHQKCKLIYLDETWVDNNLTFGKCWSSDDVSGVLTNTSSSNRLIVVSAGSEDGFVHEATLIFRAGKVTGDYHGQMNGVNFEKWINEKLLPKLSEKSVIVLDNAPYHCIQENKTPSKYSVKKVMVDWLTKNKIPCSMEMKKFELLELITQNKPPEKIYRIDEILKSRGHIVIRLPPYMCDLNPIELAWAKMKRKIKEENITGDLSLTKLEEATKNAIDSITKIDWEGFTSHTLKVEQDYWIKDSIMEDTVDRFVIELGGVDSEESESGDSHTDSVSDSELATPF